MPYDNYGEKMGSTKGGGKGNPKNFQTVRYSDRGERKGEQGTRGAYNQGMGPRIVGTPGPKAA